MEQRINLKFLVKLRKTPIECFKLLKEVYGEDVMSIMQIFEWHKRFEKGREEVEDDPKTGRPSTMRKDKNIIGVKQLVQSDRRLTVRMILDELSLNRQSVWTILLHDLGCKRCVPKWCPRFCRKTRSRAESNFVKTCWRKLKTFRIFLGRSSQEIKLGFYNTTLK